MDKPIVRESKYRNVFHKVCKKELFFTNLKVNTSADELLKSSKTLFAYPSMVGGGSCLSVQKLSSTGKVPDTPFHIKGHTDPITCFEFSPFNDRVVATGSRDCTVKLWSVDDEDMDKSISISDPLITLPKLAKRPTGLYFHPSVDSMLVTATSGDYSIDVWDVSQTQQVLSMTGNTDVIMSLAWNGWNGGNLCATSSRDKKMRLYDPRKGATPIKEVSTHEGAQGFRLTWADSNGLDLLCTTGANKGALRQLMLWDPRAMDKELVNIGVTTDSSVLTPFYDYGTNLLYLGGKGDGIYYYELDRSNAHFIGKAVFGSTTQSAISLLPKRVCDVSLCEVDRFLRLTNCAVEMVSFIVPRKTPTLFQEDIFPPAPSGDPTTDLSTWLENKDMKLTPHVVTMKPEGSVSIYEVSEEEGGKSKQKEKLEQALAQSSSLNASGSIMKSSTGVGTGESSSFIIEGVVKQEIEGWLFNTYQPRYLKIVKEKLYCFLNEDSAQALWELSFANVKFVDVYDRDEDGEISVTKEWLTRFTIVANNGKEYKLESDTVELRDQWITSINAYRDAKQAEVTVQTTSPTLSDYHVVNNQNINNSPLTISKSIEDLSLNNQLEDNSNSSNNNSNNVSSNRPPIKRNHSILSRNPSYTKLKISSGMPPPTSTPPLSTNPMKTSTNLLPPIFGSSMVKSSSTDSISSTTSSSSTNTIKQVDIIIEGSLFELVPGLLWNSNVEKWYIVSDGMLYSYRNKQVKDGEPMETIHLEKALSVHKTKDIFTRIEGFSFQLTTPNRIIHLLTKSKEEMKSWVSVLKQNIKNDGEDKPTINKQQQQLAQDGADLIEAVVDDGGENNQGGQEQDDEELLEGQVSRKLNGMFSMWGTGFLSLLGEDLFLSKSKLATAPELRIPMVSVATIKKLTPTDFTLYDKMGAVICNFRSLIPPTEDFDDCVRWVDGLEAARKRSIDIIKLFNISEKDGEVDADSTDAKFIDLTAVKNGKTKMMMQVKGRRKIRVVLAPLESSSLNTHNSFVLDAGARIYVWAGAKSARVNRAKALDLANRIRTKERGGKSTVLQLDEGREEGADDFWSILGGRTSSGTTQSITPEEQDSESVKMSIYRIGIDSKKNTLRARLAWEGSDWRLPVKEILNTKFVYVVDCGVEIYVWIGKESAAAQRRMGNKVALALLSNQQTNTATTTTTVRPSHSRITRILEFGENNLFKEKFANFPGMLPISTTKMEVKSSVAVTRAEHPLDYQISKLQSTLDSYSSQKIITNDPSGKVTIWKIEDYEKVGHPTNLYGQFFAADSYIVLYTYTLANKETHIIYYYLGRDSTINDKGTSAYLTVDLHDSLGGNCTQVRVVQNKECRNFLNLFKGKMMVHSGKHANYDPMKPALYEVRGRLDEIDVRAVCVDNMKASSLNSHHVFIATDPVNSKVWVWNGKYSSSIERSMALEILKTTSLVDGDDVEQKVINEGEEPNEFWDVLGGRSQITLTQPQQKPTTDYRPRLFACSNATGINEINQESPFSQDDLDQGSVIILDVQTHIYIWLGLRAPHRTKKCAMETAIGFVNSSKLGHSPSSTGIFIVEPFVEPASFKSYFRAWSTSNYPKQRLPVVEKECVPVDQILKDYLREVYTYEELMSDPLPAGVDATKLELYLQDDEFTKIFNMSRKEWEKIPSWRRENIKRSVFLF